MSALPFRDLTEAILPFPTDSLLLADQRLDAVIEAAVNVVRAEHAYERTPFGDRERARFLAMLERRLDEAGIRW